MPNKNDWRKFKISFCGGISEQFVAWGELIKETLAALSDASRLLAGFAEPSVVKLLTDDINTLNTRAQIAHRTYKEGGTANIQIAMSLVPIIETEAETLLAQVKLALRENPAGLMGQGDNGQQMLEQLVEESGNDESDKEFLKAALEARFDIKLGGKLGKKFLPRLFEILLTLPEDHVKDNPGFVKVIRDVNLEYGGSYNSHSQITEVGLKNYDDLLHGKVKHPQDSDVPTANKLVNRRTNTLTHTVAHEVGHAVDYDQHIMTTLSGNAAYAAWAYHSPGELAAIIAKHAFKGSTFVNFCSAFLSEQEAIKLLTRSLEKKGWDPVQKRVNSRIEAAANPPSIMKLAEASVLKEADALRLGYLSDGMPPQEAVVNEVNRLGNNVNFSAISLKLSDGHLGLAIPIIQGAIKRIVLQQETILSALTAVYPNMAALSQVVPNWSGAAMHDANIHCEWLQRAQASGGLWKKGSSGARKATLGGRVYGCSANGKFHSYLFSDRTAMVSNYQYAAPPEWFAELYAMYYTDNLKPSHTHYNLLDDLDDVLEDIRSGN